ISDFSGRMNKLGTASFSGSQIGFSTGFLYVDDGWAEILGTRDTDGSIILWGDQRVTVDRNAPFTGLKAYNTGNYVSGAARFSNPLTLRGVGTDLSVELYGTLNNNIVLNNGWVYLRNDLVFADDYSMTGSGICYLQDRTVTFGADDLSFLYTLSWVGDGAVEINSDITMTGTWVFIGESTLRGNGNRIILDPDGALIVWHNSTAKFENVIIEGLAQSAQSAGTYNLRCLDSDSKIILRDTKLILDQDYSFTKGTIDVERSANFLGDGKTFNYTSDLDFTIKNDSKLTFDPGFKFSYTSLAGTNDHFVMQDATSELFLDGCTLHATDVGLRLETGKVTVKDKVALESDATIQADAVEFDSAMEVKILSGATLDVKGILVYD
ncbi:hypothetical protein ACFLY6_02265, partial [Candidatus Dependentiae bacterium]